jgi:molybdopterin-biosynthesis enzyme MoeA-like protein
LIGNITQDQKYFDAHFYMHSRGVDLTRVEFIPDSREEIRSTVLELKERVGSNGFVFTSGGIGPTHDDVTYESIASAFGEG